MSDHDDFTTELEFIQNIIDRQAENSFKIKGWTVTLVVVTLLFRTENFQLFVSIIPLFAFWSLDAYYLQVERQYREMYETVRKAGVDNDRDRFKMNPSEFSDDVDSVIGLMMSNSILWFYGSILLLIALYTILLYCSEGTSGVENAHISRQLLIKIS